MSPAQALQQASDFIVNDLWPNTIDMIKNSYFLMLFLFGGLLASAFEYFGMAKDNI